MAININDLKIQNINFTIDTFDEKNGTDFTLSEYAPNIRNLSGRTLSGKIIKTFDGGKSGDSVLLIEHNNKQYVLKLFKDHIKAKSVNEKLKTAMQDVEINRHKDFLNLFKNEYVPCPYIYCYGKVDIGDNKNAYSFRKYIIMEYSVGPELHNYIFDICGGKNATLIGVNMKNIMLELFYVICKMIINGITHCDLHAKNIIIVKTDMEGSIDFGTLFEDGRQHKLSKYRIKILDFGLAVNGHMSCEKKRALSASIVDLRYKCMGSKRSAIMQLIAGETPLLSYNGNTDLLFFCNILKAIKTSKKALLSYTWASNINISLIRDVVDFIKVGDKLSNKNTTGNKTILGNIYQELIQSSKNANASRKRIKLCIKERTQNGTSKTLKYTRSNNNSNSKNRNTTCKYYSKTVDPNSGAITIQSTK